MRQRAAVTRRAAAEAGVSRQDKNLTPFPSRSMRLSFHSPHASARRRPAAASADLQPFDVVALPSPSRALAAVLRLRPATALLAPLALELSTGLYLLAELEPVELPLESLQPVDALYSERGVADRVANPHGEHAEGVWQLLLDAAE